MPSIGLQPLGDIQNIGSNGGENNQNYSPYSDDVALTKREIEVLQEMADGLSSKLIGKKFFLSEETIKSYRKNILLKLSASNAVNAVAIGIRAGIIS